MDSNLPRVAPQPDGSWAERDAMEELYRLCAPRVAAKLRRRFGRGIEADADDLVQETYARLVSQNPADIRRPMALLMRVATNLANDLLRRRAVRGRYADYVQAGHSQDTSQSSPMDDLLLKETIQSIPEAYQQVFVLSRFHGLTYEEIATRCGLSVKAVEWRLSKAIAHCLHRMQD
jgi:RNA polymerase sigma-70 factor (ECF subfamily)